MGLNKIQELNALKLQYNKLLQREKKAEAFLNTATEEQYVKWLPEYLKITKELSIMIMKYESLTGEKMSEEEMFKGFLEKDEYSTK